MKSRKQIFKEIASVSFHRPGWMTASILLALLSSLAFLVPYVCIWRIVRTTVTLWPSVGGETSELIRLGLWAFFGAAASLLAYYGALICSHMAAFHTVHDMRLSFLRRRNLLVKLMREIPGLEVNEPQGAFYLLPKCSGYYGTKAGDRVIENSTDLAMYLLEEGHVATVPGSAFGAPDCLRLSYATSDENIMEAVDRIKCALSALKRD